MRIGLQYHFRNQAGSSRTILIQRERIANLYAGNAHQNQKTLLPQTEA
ncbi:MAG: hypothetical protein AVDCRST_MAG03-3814 [uncultured Rubrobacteraceae bacterium]|uniref:Uncharacterized protein n=1 Tax=uncultured Rubrobacteraceae bacterium TaxID=349277 RepID=A0A6J4QJ79_9ACTN|nr:MAG: hypothetical protein AVDCRST_MAG03-3814 [uncultured Rubrobacteraceae bacterium]